MLKKENIKYFNCRCVYPKFWWVEVILYRVWSIDLSIKRTKTKCESIDLCLEFKWLMVCTFHFWFFKSHLMQLVYICLSTLIDEANINKSIANVFLLSYGWSKQFYILGEGRIDPWFAALFEFNWLIACTFLVRSLWIHLLEVVFQLFWYTCYGRIINKSIAKGPKHWFWTNNYSQGNATFSELKDFMSWRMLNSFLK